MAKRWILGISTLVVVALVAAACGGSSKGSPAGAGGNKSSAPGVTPGEVKIGVLSTLTGIQGSDYQNSLKGLRARVQAQNAEGGVNGRKIVLDVKDDEGSTAGNLTAGQLLITEGSFLVVEATQYDAASARYFHNAGIPVLGQNNTNTYGTQPFTNMFGTTGSHDPVYPAITTWGKWLASKGVKALATVGYGTAATSVDAAKAFAASAKAAGLQAPYVNTTLPLTGANYTATALQIKDSGADAVYGAMGTNANLALAQAVRQSGARVKVFLFPTGGSQVLLDAPASGPAMQGNYYFANLVPPQVGTPATNSMQAALKQYEGITYPADYFLEEGYVEGSLLVEALKVAGRNPTRASVIHNLRAVANFTADGLETAPVNFHGGDTAFGVGPNDGAGAGECVYFLQAVGHAFIPQDRQPVCGSIIHKT